MESNLISVLIPAYNHEKYIQETIKSIINQSYRNIELIVIDDGSKDLTWQKIQEIKEECEKRFVNIHFETKQNEGTCKTMNKLLSYANGDFIYLIASDDLAKSQAIEKEVEFLSKNPDYALCVGDNELIDANSTVGYWDKDRNFVYNLKDAKFKTFAQFIQKRVKFKLTSNKFGRYDKLFEENHIPNGYLIKKSILKKTGYFTPEAPLEDWWLMLQISKYAKLKYLDEVLFSYRWHSTNTIKQTDKIENMGKQTIVHENKIIENIDINSLPKFCQKYVKKINEQGICTYKIGIPFIITINNYKKGNDKFKSIKLFNCDILQYKK